MPLVLFLHCTTTPPPLWCARVPSPQDRVPSQVAMAVAMVDNCHGSPPPHRKLEPTNQAQNVFQGSKVGILHLGRINCSEVRDILTWFTSGRVWWRLGLRPAGSIKMKGSRVAACCLPDARAKSVQGTRCLSS